VLTEATKRTLDARITALEAATGVQVVTAIVPRADAYPELPWTAFALAASLAGLVVVALDLLRPDWMSDYVALSHVMPVLGAGALAAVAVAVVPALARLFVRPARAAHATRRLAQCLFVDHDLGRTQGRNAVLLLVARFERRVELVADHGHDGRIARDDWRAVVDAATAGLARGDGAGALLAALDRLEAVLAAHGFRPAADALPDELPNATIEVASP
jgi:putative membrane protein